MQRNENVVLFDEEDKKCNVFIVIKFFSVKVFQKCWRDWVGHRVGLGVRQVRGCHDVHGAEGRRGRSPRGRVRNQDGQSRSQFGKHIFLLILNFLDLLNLEELNEKKVELKATDEEILKTEDNNKK